MEDTEEDAAQGEEDADDTIGDNEENRSSSTPLLSR